MRIIILIITVLFCFNVSGQRIVTNNQSGGTNTLVQNGDTIIETKTPEKQKVDSMDIKIISMKELNALLERINNVALDNLSVRQRAAYDLILKELKTIYSEADKKRRYK